jgi:hypothetical protein
MLIMRGTDETNAAMMADIDEMMAATRLFIEDTAKAGVYVAAEGLDDPGQGVVVHFSDEAPVITDGPYGETKELFGGFFLLDVASKQEATSSGPSGSHRSPGPRSRSGGCPGKTRSRRIAESSSRKGPCAGARPDLMGTADVEAVWRIESARIVASAGLRRSSNLGARV